MEKLSRFSQLYERDTISPMNEILKLPGRPTSFWFNSRLSSAAQTLQMMQQMLSSAVIFPCNSRLVLPNSSLPPHTWFCDMLLGQH